MLGLPEGVAGPHPFLANNQILGIFSKLCMHRVAYDLERSFKDFSDIFGQAEGRDRATPIF